MSSQESYKIESDQVLASRKDGVGFLTLNRPASRNSLSSSMLDGIREGLAYLDTDASVRVIVITGAGEGFCSGGDLKDMIAGEGMFGGSSELLREKYVNGVQANTRRLAAVKKPLIAAINGHAIGAGMGIALSCDIRVMSEEAKMGATFPKIGLIAGDGTAYLLQRAIGLSRAAELLLTARTFKAEEAYRLGIAHYVVPPSEVLAKATEIAESIVSLPPNAVQLTKSLLYEGLDGTLGSALSFAAAYQVIAHQHPEHEEAVHRMIDQISSRGSTESC